MRQQRKKKTIQPGTLITLALFQTENKIYSSERERLAAKRQRLLKKKEEDYSSIGEWSPEDEMPDFDELIIESKSPDLESYKTFIAGWEAFKKKSLEEITLYSSKWLKNGPSIAAAEAIKKRLESIPIPTINKILE